METTEKPSKRILGVNDDRSDCCCCGKSDLKKVVWIENTLTGEILHFGEKCATKAAPALFGEIKDAKKDFDNELIRRKNEAVSRRSKKFVAAKTALYKSKGGTYRKSGFGGNIPCDSDLMQSCHDECLIILKEPFENFL